MIRYSGCYRAGRYGRNPVCENTFQNISQYRIVVSAKNILPHFEFLVTKRINVDRFSNVTDAYEFSSHSYALTKLAPPYTDRCMDYPNIGYRNQLDAINDCILNVTMKLFKSVAKTKIVTESMKHLHNFKIFGSLIRGRDDTQKCYDKYRSEDCYAELTYTDFDKLYDKTDGGK